LFVIGMKARRSITGMKARPSQLALLTLALATGGCSFVFVDGPPAAHKKLPYFECTSGRGWPSVDLALGAIYGIAGAAAIADGDGYNSSESAITAVAAGALFAASAVYGYSKTETCREAKAELIARLPNSPAMPGPAAPAYDPWLAPANGPFAAPPTSAPTTSAPGAAPAAPPAGSGPAVDGEAPRP
jgi:hypothetical protein